MNKRNIEVRYNLLQCIVTAIKDKLSKEELLSAIISECNFDKTTKEEYILAVFICRRYLEIIQLRVKSWIKMKHKIKKKQKYYRPDDFWVYEIICTCGKKVGGWSPDEVEKAFVQHCESEWIMADKECNKCRGSGEIPTLSSVLLFKPEIERGDNSMTYIKCPKCEGRGYVLDTLLWYTMYKAKITNLEGINEEHWLNKKHKVGDIIEFADCWIGSLRKFVGVLEHYRMVTRKKETCTKCGQVIIKRRKEVLDY